MNDFAGIYMYILFECLFIFDNLTPRFGMRELVSGLCAARAFFCLLLKHFFFFFFFFPLHIGFGCFALVCFCHFFPFSRFGGWLRFVIVLLTGPFY